MARSCKRRKVITLACAAALATVGAVATARAGVVTMNFDCTMVTGSTCTRGSSLGSLTISDSAADPKRVDIDLYVGPHAGITRISKLYLNFNYLGTEFLGGRSFSIVPMNAPIYTFGIKSGHSLTLDGVGPQGTRFDVSLSPSANGLTYSGSLVLGLTSGPAYEVDLDAEMFLWQDKESELFAAFETDGALVGGATSAYMIADPPSAPSGGNPPGDNGSGDEGGSQPPEHPPQGGIDPPPSDAAQRLPEPSTLALIGLSATALGLALRRRALARY